MISGEVFASGAGGNVLFFCVAGQNRSATLAVAVQILQGKKLEEILTVCARSSALHGSFFSACFRQSPPPVEVSALHPRERRVPAAARGAGDHRGAVEAPPSDVRVAIFFGTLSLDSTSRGREPSPQLRPLPDPPKAGVLPK